MSGEVVVDALPYIDIGYDEPGVKQAALSLVEEECKRYKPSKNYLDFLGPVNLHAFETEMLKNEFDRLEQRVPMEPLNFKRYELPPPPPNKQTDASAWFECVENSCAQLEHQATRLMNLEIMAEYGSGAWRVYNQTLKIMFDQAEKQLELLKKQIQTINLSRKTEQTYSGVKIKSLEDNWVGLVSKNYEIECAVAELEKELVEMKKNKIIDNVNVMNIGATDENTAVDTENIEELKGTADLPVEKTEENNESEVIEEKENLEDMPVETTKITTDVNMSEAN